MANETKPSDLNTEATWWVEPRSPLAFRTGRVGIHGSAGKEVFEFPVPGTIAGAVRAAYADANDWNFTDPHDHTSLVESIKIHGPLLARQTLRGDGLEVYFPKPSDAVYLSDPDDKVCTAYPVKPSPDEGCDLPHLALIPAVLDATALAKPVRGPAFWSAAMMRCWLQGSVVTSTPEQCGVEAPPTAVRTHVQMNRARRAHEDEGLFESAGLDFAPPAKRSNDDERIAGWDDRQYGMLVRTTMRYDLQQTIDGCVRRVGADGRTAYFCASDHWPVLPPELAVALGGLKKGDWFRLVLATPAIFKNGWLPGWLGDDLTGSPPGLPAVRVKLIAAAVDRWQPYSGWAMARKHGQRAIRRLVPAGAVYWFELIAGRGEDIADLWLQPISDNPADRNDSFGMVLPGVARTRPDWT